MSHPGRAVAGLQLVRGQELLFVLLLLILLLLVVLLVLVLVLVRGQGEEHTFFEC